MVSLVEQVINIGSLQQGSISETGTNISSTEYVRTSGYITGNFNFNKCRLDCKSTFALPYAGSTSGITDVRHSIPGLPNKTGQFSNIDCYVNGNYFVYYYHFYIHKDDSYYGDNTLWWAGYAIVVIPTAGGNHATEKPWVKTYMDNEYPTSSSNYNTKSSYCEDIDVVGNSITYYNSGQSGATTSMTLLQYVAGSVDTSIYHYSAEGRFSREATIVPCEVALLGFYRNENANLVYSNRWILSDPNATIDYTSVTPVMSWKFVFHVQGIANLVVDYICNHSITLIADSWALNTSSILRQEDIPESVEGPRFVEPYPTSFWYLNETPQVSFFELPEPDDGPTFQYPYPASLWWYDEVVDRVRNIMIPDELFADPTGGAFYHAENLEYVKIPRSVTSIGQTAFEGTQVKEVCISRTCKYSKSSFPKDCKVIFYEDMYDENYRIVVSGKHSYRYTETIAHSEDSTSEENP